MSDSGSHKIQGQDHAYGQDENQCQGLTDYDIQADLRGSALQRKLVSGTGHVVKSKMAAVPIPIKKSCLTDRLQAATSASSTAGEAYPTAGATYALRTKPVLHPRAAVCDEHLRPGCRHHEDLSP